MLMVPRIDRRRLLAGLALSSAAGAAVASPAGPIANAQTPAVLTGTRFELEVSAATVDVTGRRRPGVAVNGSIPAPTLHWREGDDVEVIVHNRLAEPSSIHWHGIRLPAEMDGTPGLSFAGIPPRSSFTYRIPVRQSGTYWYHGHSGAQEPLGLYGAIVIEPKGADPNACPADHVVMLGDWSDEGPMRIISNLKQRGDYYNTDRPTLARLAEGLGARAMWGAMRMSDADISDVTGATFTYLVNGRSPKANWTALFQPGQKVRLRLINAGVMTIFDVMVPGLPLSVVQSDGWDIQPVTVEELRIGPGETWDVIVEPKDQDAYAIFAQAIDRSGFARGTLASRPGLIAPVPPMDPRPRRTMADMGMAHQGAGHQHGAPAPTVDHSAHTAAAPAAAPAEHDHTTVDHSAHMAAGAEHDHGAIPGMDQIHAAEAAAAPIPRANADGIDPLKMRGRPDVDNVAVSPANRLAEAGAGLDGNGRRVLTYADIRGLQAGPDRRPPGREIEFRVTGNMERWTWGFDGKTFAESGPIRLKLGERVRFVLVNDTMMEHPVHLHGLFSELENGAGDRLPLKHTITMKPGERMSFLVSADTPGHWAFHCHLLYHMHRGMFRTVVVS